MKETKVPTLVFDEDSELFDDALRSYLVNRELLRADPEFFIKDGKPYWIVFLETRLLKEKSGLPLNSRAG